MVTNTTSGSKLFRLHRPGASRVALSGSFTGWDADAISMTDAGDGWWEIELVLAAGDYDFQYVVDGWIRIADYAANGVKLNAFGQWVSLLTIEEPIKIGRAHV